MKRINIYIILAGLLLSSCEEFLTEPPNQSESIEIKSVEHLERLLNDYDTFGPEGNKEAFYGSDGFGLVTDLFDATEISYPSLTVNYGSWDTEYVKDDLQPYFSEEWKKVFVANLVLEYVEEVAVEDDYKKELIAEAHFIRAYSYFNMVNTFCLPYSSANANELGLPIKLSTELESDQYRVTLEETWTFILEELEEGLKLTKELDQNSDSNNKTWRASKIAVQAFAARVYLAINDYANGEKYAQMVLDQYQELVDYNTEMSYYTRRGRIMEDGELAVVEVDYPYTYLAYDASERMAWKELLYYRFSYNGSQNYIPSAELINKYDQQYDLRYKYHFVEGHTYLLGANGIEGYGPLYDYPYYFQFGATNILAGPTTAEMILTKAECQIRQGNWTDGMITVNQLRAVRMDNSAPADMINLDASNQDEALMAVIDERFREMPFTMRYFDVRRYNNNDVANDDVVLKKNFYPIGERIDNTSAPIDYTMETKSRKYARPLPTKDILSSNGTLEQNTY